MAILNRVGQIKRLRPTQPSSVPTLAFCFLFLPLASLAAAADPVVPEEDKTDTQARPELRTRPSDPAESGRDRRASVITTDVDLVLINVTVTDPMGRMVTGLQKEHFKVLEDKIGQEIVQFGAEDSPLSLAIVFDASGSMGHKMSKAREAIAQFFRTANPEDEFFLVQFNNQPEIVSDFTRSLEDIQSRLTFVQSKGRTALLDAIYLALNKMKEAKEGAKKALLVISDGGDNSSRYTEREIKRLVRESDVQIYAIGIFEPYGSRGRTAEEMAGPGLLTEVAESTGGRQFPVENINELPDIAEKIGIELRNQYVLGYVPENEARDGKWRRVKVEVKKIRGMPQLRSYFRNGYYASSR